MLCEARTEEGDGPQDGSEVYYAVSDYTAAEETQIDLKEGDQVVVLEKMSSDWWWAEVNDLIGYVPANHLSQSNPLEGIDRWQDDEYFSSYGTVKLQLEMLSDRHRTLAYKAAIESAKAFIQNKVVVDLGCGTGILSMFCAKLGGAKQVYAVEASEVAEQATKLVEHNGLSDVIKVIQCRAEELTLPDKVDLIVSEWMGTLLLFELMVESVLLTRDRCLKDSGVMWPSEAELFLVPCSAQVYHEEKVAFWSDVYGFDFSPLVPLAQSEMLGRPIHNYVLPHGDCLCNPVTIMRLHLKTLQLQDIETTESSFKCKVTKPGTFHGFGSWFEVKFGDIPAEYNYQPITLSTSPQHPLVQIQAAYYPVCMFMGEIWTQHLTHWKQDLLMVDTPLSVKPDDIIEGKIKISRNQQWRRHLRVMLVYCHISGEQVSQEFKKEYALWR